MLVACGGDAARIQRDGADDGQAGEPGIGADGACQRCSTVDLQPMGAVRAIAQGEGGAGQRRIVAQLHAATVVLRTAGGHHAAVDRHDTRACLVQRGDVDGAAVGGGAGAGDGQRVGTRHATREGDRAAAGGHGNAAAQDGGAIDTEGAVVCRIRAAQRGGAVVLLGASGGNLPQVDAGAIDAQAGQVGGVAAQRDVAASGDNGRLLAGAVQQAREADIAVGGQGALAACQRGVAGDVDGRAGEVAIEGDVAGIGLAARGVGGGH